MTNIYFLAVQTAGKSLGTLIDMLKKTEAWSQEVGKSETEILESRLAPDMFTFTKQVQLVSDNAKGMTSRFTGKENPSMPDTETTFAQLITRLEKTLEYVNSFSEADFADSHQMQISLPYFPGKYQDAQDYLMHYGLPNFFFHLTAAYCILRNLGMPVGKADYIGFLNLKDL